jgi:hypothetical protein
MNQRSKVGLISSGDVTTKIREVIKMAGVDTESRQLLTDLLKIAGSGSSPTRSSGMKTTLIAGYPVFASWGTWIGHETNEKGVTKATLCVPYLQNAMVAMTKFSGATSLETPLDMFASEIINPYNCKLNVTPGIDLNRLVNGKSYYFLLAVKPAGFIQSGNVTSYWDGAVKAVGDKASIFKEYFDLLTSTVAQWAAHQKSLESGASFHEVPDGYQDLAVSVDG